MTTPSNDARTDAAAALAARGDSDAFELLCHLLQDDVWRYCSAVIGDPELAADAAQDTFVRAVSAIRRFRGDCPARLYVLVLARRACAAALRKHSTHGRHLPLDAVPEAGVAAHSGVVETTLLLHGLPDDLRQAFVLTQLLGLPYAEAGRVAGCPVGTVRSRVFRARERLVADLNAAEGEGRSRAN